MYVKLLGIYFKFLKLRFDRYRYIEFGAVYLLLFWPEMSRYHKNLYLRSQTIFKNVANSEELKTFLCNATWLNHN